MAEELLHRINGMIHNHQYVIMPLLEEMFHQTIEPIF